MRPLSTNVVTGVLDASVLMLMNVLNMHVIYVPCVCAFSWTYKHGLVEHGEDEPLSSNNSLTTIK